MKRFNNLSFVSRIGLAMLLSLALNFAGGFFLKKQLLQNEYVLDVEVDYTIPGTMELHFDTGRNFNQIQEVVKVVLKGENTLQFPFELEKEEQLNFLRLDFGNKTGLSEVQLKSMTLSTPNKTLFELDATEISKQISLLQGVEQVENSAVFKPISSKNPYDPYIVFRPVNELMYPLWQRTMFLLVPWILLLFFPILNWVKERFAKKQFALFLVALFLASIPLKIAWVTFTALLLLAYSLFVFLKTREVNFSSGSLASSSHII